MFEFYGGPSTMADLFEIPGTRFRLKRKRVPLWITYEDRLGKFHTVHYKGEHQKGLMKDSGQVAMVTSPYLAHDREQATRIGRRKCWETNMFLRLFADAHGEECPAPPYNLKTKQAN